jgi:hypothetical protein
MQLLDISSLDSRVMKNVRMELGVSSSEILVRDMLL